MEKKPGRLIDFSNLESNVTDQIVGGQQQQQPEGRAEKTRGQKKRAAKQKRIDAARNRRQIDINPGLERQLEEIADELSVPFSQLICRLAWEGMKSIDLESLKGELVNSRSMRYFYNLPLPDERPKRRR